MRRLATHRVPRRTVATGVVQSADNLEALDKTGDPDALATEFQSHPSLEFGLIGRVLLGPTVGWYVDLRSWSFIEVFESDTLEVVQSKTVTTGLSFGRRRND